MSAANQAGAPSPCRHRVVVRQEPLGTVRGCSDSGAVAYVRANAGTVKPLQWLRRGAAPSTLRNAPLDWSNPSFSPDGRRIAFDIFDGTQTDIWLYEWDRDVISRLTFEPTEDWKPVWSPDGAWIVYVCSQQAFNLCRRRADGTGTREPLTRTTHPQFAESWHPSGQVFAFTENDPDTNSDIMLLPFGLTDAGNGTPGVPVPFLKTPATEFNPAFSPDGKWIAYVSNASGKDGVYVRPYPGPGEPSQIAPEGLEPTWSHTHNELLFLGPDQRIMSSSYTARGGSFRADPPRPWAPGRLMPSARGIGTYEGRGFDLHPDGERLVGAWTAESEAVAPRNSVVLVFNFFDELRRVAPITR